MIKKNLKLLIITTIVILLPMLAGVIMWDSLPQELPIHWNVNGEVDDTCSKEFGVFLAPLIMIALQWITVFVVSSDPKKQNQSDKMLAIAFWCVPLITNVVAAILFMTSLGKEVAVLMIISVSLGLLTVIIGNYLPKCKQNYTVGIKLPWTLGSEENWNKTHRLAGWLWVACGFIIAIVGCFGWIWIVIPMSLVMVTVPVVYSYAVYRGESKN